MAGKIDEEDKGQMEAALVEALEWLEEQDGGAARRTAEEEDYEEKLREVEEVHDPIIKQVGQRGWGRGAGSAARDEERNGEGDEGQECHRTGREKMDKTS
jgi:heat shock protein 5